MESSLLQAEQLQLSQPFFIGEVFIPLMIFCGPPLDLLKQLYVVLLLLAVGWMQFSRLGFMRVE